MTPWNIAHRGGAALMPENSLAAFADAVTRGADGAELDVQLSRDGEVVVFHDNRLKPEICRDSKGEWLTPPTPKIVDLTFSELRTYDIGRAKPGSKYASEHTGVTSHDGQHIPLLSEVVEVAKTSPKPFHLFVELKTSFADRTMSATPEALAEATVGVLKELDYLDRTIFVGFDWPGLIHAMKIEPAARCWFTTLAESWFRDGQPPAEDGPPAEPALQMLRHLARTGQSPWAGGFDAVNYGGSILRAIKAAGGEGWFPYFPDATDEAVTEARALGLKVGAWTVDSLGDMRALMGRGLDALCTDRPDIMASIDRG